MGEYVHMKTISLALPQSGKKKAITERVQYEVGFSVYHNSCTRHSKTHGRSISDQMKPKLNFMAVMINATRGGNLNLTSL